MGGSGGCVQLSKSYRLVCGPSRSPVKSIYTLLAPRPLDGGVLSTPLVIMTKDERLQASPPPLDPLQTPNGPLAVPQ
eukprot:4472727-Pyramimonas_sp.AAC.1